MNCKTCNSKKIIKITNLDYQPISSVFLTKKKLNLKKYNINLFECSNCKLIQFKSLPPLGEMYGQTYGYRTSLSKLMVRHMRSKFKKFTKLNTIKKNSSILDIGSNDGTGSFIDGHIGALRITKGVARYTSNFTPPTEPFVIVQDYSPDAVNWADFLDTSTTENSWMCDNYSINTDEDDFVMTPAIVEHSIPYHNNCDEHRITIALNIKIE